MHTCASCSWFLPQSTSPPPFPFPLLAREAPLDCLGSQTLAASQNYVLDPLEARLLTVKPFSS